MSKLLEIVNISPKKTIYTCDYLNLFSDFREIKYKKDNIDFHQVKHFNKEKKNSKSWARW